MPKALSFDLRSRVLAAIDAGLSCRQAATRFGVSASSAIRWQGMRRAGGDARPKPQGGDRLSRRTEAHAELIHAALAEVPDITLPELKARLAENGAFVSVSALWRFCRRHKITRKKRPRTRPSRTGPTSASGARPGSRASWISIPRGWSSSMRPGLPPTWPGARGGRPGETSAHWRAPRPLEDNHLRGRAAPERCCGALRAGRADQPQRG